MRKDLHCSLFILNFHTLGVTVMFRNSDQCYFSCFHYFLLVFGAFVTEVLRKSRNPRWWILDGCYLEVMPYLLRSLKSSLFVVDNKVNISRCTIYILRVIFIAWTVRELWIRERGITPLLRPQTEKQKHCLVWVVSNLTKLTEFCWNILAKEEKPLYNALFFTSLDVSFLTLVYLFQFSF